MQLLPVIKFGLIQTSSFFSKKLLIGVFQSDFVERYWWEEVSICFPSVLPALQSFASTLCYIRASKCYITGICQFSPIRVDKNFDKKYAVPGTQIWDLTRCCRMLHKWDV